MKKILLMVLSVCMFMSGLSYASAENITYKRLNNIYFNLTVDGKFESNHVTMFYLGSRLAYCIEPGAPINTKTYDANKDWSKTNLSKEKQQYIEKLGYFGYEYPGHQTDKYYIATQELIWRAVKNVSIKWTTAENNGGSVINIENEKNEILRLVNESKLKPSFIDETISGEVDETIEVEDTNKVLKDYTMGKSNYHDIKVIDNKLQITFNKEEQELEEITLTKKKYDNNILLVYTKSGSQQLAALRLSNPETVTLKLQNHKTPQPEEPEKPKQPETPKEIVKVPSTADNDQISRFGVLLVNNYAFGKFN